MFVGEKKEKRTKISVRNKSFCFIVVIILRPGCPAGTVYVLVSQ